MQIDVPFGGTHGYSMPRCESCPNAQFSQAAVNHKYQGTTMVAAIIGVDGKPTDLHVLKGLPYGLTQSALMAVQSWRFTPATGPDGRPAAVRTMIEVTFRLY